MQHDAWVRTLVSDRLGGCFDCSLLSDLNHRVYRVSTPSGSRILKVGKVGHDQQTNAAGTVARDSLAKERLLLERLLADGFPVPRVEFFELEAASRPWLLMEDCGSRTVAQCVARADRSAGHQPQSVRLLQQLGRLLAQLHQRPMPAAGMVEYDAAQGDLTIRPRDWAALADRLGRVAAGAVQRGWLSPREATPFREAFCPPETCVRLCHGDYHAVQSIVNDDRICAIVDWQSAWAGEPLVDLAVAETNLAMYLSANGLEAFRQGYCEGCNDAGGAPWLAEEFRAARTHLGRCQALALVEVAERTGQVTLREQALRLLRGQFANYG